MSSTLVRSVMTALVLGLAAHASAQAPAPAASVPQVVRVEGHFVPANGLAPAALETVTLSIYGSATDATPLFEETQEVRVDAQGRYAVFLGATRAEGLPAGLFAAAEQRWLGLRFARPGESEQARVPLASVPYALRASDADTLGGLPPTAFLRAEGAPAGASAAAGDRSSTRGDGGPGPYVSTGTANFIGKFTNAVDLTSSVLFDSGTRIGLGTTTPLDFLHVRFADTIGAFTGLALQNTSSSAASYSGMLFYDHTGALGQFQGFNNTTKEYRINNIAPGGTINFMLGGTSRFLVRSDGDIDLSGAVRRNGLRILQANTAGNDNNLLVGSFGPILGGLAGVDNTSVGTYALQLLNTASANTAIGSGALRMTNGSDNVAVGAYVLSESTGSANIAIGRQAGGAKVTGNGNIYLGGGVADDVNNVESNTIRIGDTGGYNRFFVGAVRGVTTGVANALPVVIDGNGQLGTINSSRRYKDDIRDMGEASSGLMKLRPVTYRYTQTSADGSTPLDYGLIAEEVKDVYPDVVVHLPNGDVESVQYHKINAMLLNEVQKQHRQIADQQSELAQMKARLAALERLLASDKQ